MGLFREDVDPLAGIKPIRQMKVKASGYITSQSANKSVQAWHTRPNSSNADIENKLHTSSGDSRDLMMNTSLANSIIDTVCLSTLGPGLIPQSTPDYELLGITKKEAQDWAKDLERRFDTWASSPRCDHSGQRNFYDLQLVAFKSALVSGDIFATFPWKTKAKAGRWPWKLGVKLYEADLIRTPNNASYMYPQKDIIDGMEYNNGTLAATWIADRYLGRNVAEETKNSSYAVNFTRIPIYSPSGRQNIYHLMLPGGRPGQRRSMPFLSHCTALLKTISRHSDAELQAALIASMFTVFVRDSTGTGMGINEDYYPTEGVIGGGGTTVDDEGEQHQIAKDEGYGLDLRLSAGNILELDNGKDISVADGRTANDMYSEFHRSMVTELCSSLGLAYSQVMKVFDSSYTASRAELQEAMKTMRRFRLWFTRNFTQPALEAFIEEEVYYGRMKADGFLDDEIKRKAWSKAYWIGPSNGNIDPFKEAKASVTKVQNHLSTYSAEFSGATGERWEVAMGTLADEHELLEDLGIALAPVVLDSEEVTGPTGVDPVKPGGQSWSAEAELMEAEA